MTSDILLTLIIVSITVALLFSDRLRVDLVALLVFGLVTPAEALSGFSNPAVVTVWAVFILSGGLSRTGIANLIGQVMLRLAGASETRYKKPPMKTFRQLTRIYLILFVGLLVGIATGCQIGHTPTSPTNSPTFTPMPTHTPVSLTTQPGQTEAQVLLTPTLAPTATPSPFDNVVSSIIQRVGIDDLIFLGLSGENLVNLMISVLIVLLGSLFGAIIVNFALWAAKRTPSQFGYRLFKAVEKQVKKLLPLIFLQVATARLAFVNPALKQMLNLIYFALFVFVIAVILWKLIDFWLEGSIKQVSSPQSRDMAFAFTPLLRRLIQVVIILIGLGIVLQNFGVNLSALLAILGLGGLAVSLAAKETLEDIISGFIILLDRPFQLGDRIKIQTMDAWGDVESIGARTTRIRTLDNRLVIIPNSIIGRNQVENFSYPDPSYGVSVSLGIGYGSDINQVIDIITEAILNTPGLMESKPPRVEFMEFGDSAMIFRAIYWLRSYTDILLRTKVNKSISDALNKANIEMPFTTYDVNLVSKKST